MRGLQRNRSKVLSGGWTPKRDIGTTLTRWWSTQRSLVAFTNTAYAGTGTIAQTDNALAGVLTLFLKEVKVGDVITATGISGTVTAIASDTALTLSSSATTGAGLTFTTTPTSGVSDRISQITGAYGVGVVLTSGTDVRRPMYNATGINGRPSIQFDGYGGAGTGDQMVFTTATAQPCTVYVVFRTLTSGVNQALMDGSTAGTIELFISAVSNVVSIYAGLQLDGVHSAVGTTAHIAVAIFNGASSVIRVDGVQVAAGNAGSSAVANGVIGDNGGDELTGHEGEQLIYNVIHTTAEIQKRERYLSKEWGVTLLG